MIHQSRTATKRAGLTFQKEYRRCPQCSKVFKAQLYNDHMSACNPSPAIKFLVNTKQRINNRTTRTVSLNIQNIEKQRLEKKESTVTRRSALRMKIHSKVQKQSMPFKKKRPSITFTRNGIRSKKEAQKKQVGRTKEQEKELLSVSNAESSEEPLVNSNEQFQRVEQCEIINPERRIEGSQEVESPPVYSEPSQNENQVTRPEQPSQAPQLPISSAPVMMPLRNPRNGHNYNIQNLVHNTNSIISFIHFINGHLNNPIFIMMLQQLEQLNRITDQIESLGAHRHNQYDMTNLFAQKVHEVQVTLVNRIGVILMESFASSFGQQFQHFIHNRPELKTGFTQQEYEQIFEEAINMKEEECSICLQQIAKFDMAIELQCYHSFHPKCIKEWLLSSKRCPMCRRQQKKS